jgi:hypothetical protein
MTASSHNTSDPDEARPDAATFIRHHAGEREPDLTAAQCDLLGRVIARRIARGAKIELIARAAETALPELGAARARRLGRDETLRARAWEDATRLRASGVTEIAISAAPGACPACRAASGFPPRAGKGSLLSIPITGCTHPAGCRCRYLAANDAHPALAAPLTAEPLAPIGVPGTPSIEETASGSPLPHTGEGPEEEATRPWYRPHPPRPHGPRWSEAERTARRPTRPAPKRRPHS